MNATAFRELVHAYAESRGWRVTTIDDDHAMLQFEAPDDPLRDLELQLSPDGEALMLLAPMAAGFTDPVDLPHAFATQLLRRNAEGAPGCWCLTDVDGALTFTCMIQTPADTLGELEFDELAADLVDECLAGEELLAAFERRD